jgi:hypothetical protein
VRIGCGKQANAHRVAYELAVGAIPHGMMVCHHCDNPPCCNPTHLFVGTHSDNAKDMVAKGRKRGGRGWSRRSRIRAVNTERRKRLHDEDFSVQADLCRTLPCCVCGAPKPSDPAHVRSRGAGGKDRDTVPMCRAHHQDQHDHGFSVLATQLEHRGVDLGPYLAMHTGQSFQMARAVESHLAHVARGLEAVLKVAFDVAVVRGMGIDSAIARNVYGSFTRGGVDGL